MKEFLRGIMKRRIVRVIPLFIVFILGLSIIHRLPKEQLITQEATPYSSSGGELVIQVSILSIQTLIGFEQTDIGYTFR